MEVPALKERPELPRHLHALWSGFWRASKGRSIGMGGIGGIPLTEIEAVMRLWRIEEWSEQVDFITLIEGMDNAYLAYHAEKHEAEQKKQSHRKADT